MYHSGKNGHFSARKKNDECFVAKVLKSTNFWHTIFKNQQILRSKYEKSTNFGEKVLKTRNLSAKI